MMPADDLPEILELPTSQDWVRDTKRSHVHPRSEALKDVGKELKEYEPRLDDYAKSCQTFATNREKYDEDHQAYQQSPNLDTFAAAAKSLQQVYASFEEAGNALDAVNEAYTRWGGSAQHPSRDRLGAATDLGQRLEGAPEKFAAGRESIRSGMHLSGDLVPGELHLAWLGGKPAQRVLNSAENLAISQPGVTVHIWADPSNLLADTFKQDTAALRTGVERLTADNDPAIEARIDLWRDVPREQYLQGLDARLVATHSPLAEDLPRQQEAFEKIRRDLEGRRYDSGSRIVVHNVQDELFRAPAPPRNAGAISATQRDELHHAYQFQVVERGNFAGGADIVRVVAVHDKAGRYFDIDQLPPIRGFEELVEAHNTAMGGRPQKRNDPVRPINMENGLTVLQNPGYVVLIKAVEEHIELVRSGSADTPLENRDAYQSMLSHVEPFDAHNRVQQAFTAWAGKTQTLASAFGPLDPLYVEPPMFKAFQSGKGQAANSNAVLGASTPGAPALTELAKEIVSRTAARTRTEPEKRKYLDDSRENRDAYRAASINSHGPGVLSQMSTFADTLEQKFGVPMTSPLVMIPYHTVPHPSSQEMKHSWARVTPTPDQSSASASINADPPRRSDSPPRSVVPGGSVPPVPGQVQGQGRGHRPGRG